MGRWEKADKNNEKLSYHKGFRGINCITNENFFGGRHFHSPLCSVLSVYPSIQIWVEVWYF